MRRVFGRGRGRDAVIHGLAILVVALALTACGKKGAPQPPPGEPNTYPRVYPSE